MTNLIPSHATLRGRHRHRARQFQEIRRPRQDRTLPLNAKDDAVTFGEPERIPNGLRDRDLALRREP